VLAISLRSSVVPAMRSEYLRRRDIAYKLLANVPGLQCRLPEAGMFMLVDIRETGLSANDFAWGLFRQTGVSVLDAQAFGPTARGFVRVGFVVGEQRLGEACLRIAAYVNGLMQARQQQAVRLEG
jgi:arginine:pyruvate transaminase